MQVQEKMQGLAVGVIPIEAQDDIIGPFTGIAEKGIKKIMAAFRWKELT